MLPIEEVAKWLIKNRTDENGDLDLMGLDFSDFDGDVLASGWKVKKGLAQSHNAVGGDLNQDLDQGKKPLTPKDKGQFLLRYFKNERGDLDLSYVDLSDFKGDVAISSWKVGGDLFLDHQEVRGSLFQSNQKVGRNLYQDEQEAKGFITQDMQEAEDECVEPDYEAEYERLRKELDEANRKTETLMWVLMKIKEEAK